MKIFFKLLFALLIIANVSFAQILEENQEDQERQDFLSKIGEEIKLVNENKDHILILEKEVSLALKGKNQVLAEALAQIDKISQATKNKDLKVRQTEEYYQKSVLYWRILVDSSLSFFSTKYSITFTPSKPILDKISIPLKFEKEELVKEYLSSYEELLKRNAAVNEDKLKLIEIIQNQQSTTLLKLGKLRSDLLNELISQDSSHVGNDQFYFQDLFRELKLIPYRPLMFFYSKIFDYKIILNQGFDGFLTIASQLFVLLLLTAAVIIGITFLNKITSSLKKLKESLIYSQKNVKLAIILAKITPYFSWLFLLSLFGSILFFINETKLEEIGFIFPYFIYYFLYKIFRIFIASSINNSIYFENFALEKNSTLKINKSSKLLGLYLLISAWLLYSTQAIVRKGLFYNLVVDLFLTILIIILAYLANRWKDEINQKSKKNFSEKISNKIEILLSKRTSFFFALPLLIVLILKPLMRKFYILTTSNDFAKNILAQIYRKKLESAAKSIEESYVEKLPQNYLDLFKEGKQEFIKIKTHPYDEIEELLNFWHQDKTSKNSLVIYGESGIGKSSLSQYFVREFVKKDLKILNFKITQKITTIEQLIYALSEAFGVEKENLEESLQNYEQKTLIIIDDCHNLFLSKKFGFKAFKFFANLINLSSAKIFWFTSFDRHSWNYLSHALGAGQYFRHQFKLPRWSDVDVKNLILTAHQKGNLQLIYDSLIFSTQIDDQKDINQKFFQMLWSQSRGNPRTATFLWFSALRLLDENTIKITLPKLTKSSDLIKISDEQLFIYAAIAKHQKLSIDEIVEICDLQKGFVLNSIRLALDHGYLHEIKKENRYRLSAIWQIVFSNLLINKNFIYE